MPDGILGLAFARRGRGAPRPRRRRPPVLAARGRRRRRHRSAVRRGRADGAARRARRRASRSSGVRALDGVDLDVREGEILGVIGPNGSGKSTLINVVSGHFRADAGSVTLRRRRPARAARAPDRACRHRAHLPDPAAVRAPHGPRQRRADRDVRRRARSTGVTRPRPRCTGCSSPDSRRARTRIRATSTCTRPSSSSWRAGSPRVRAC